MNNSNRYSDITYDVSSALWDICTKNRPRPRFPSNLKAILNISAWCNAILCSFTGQCVASASGLFPDNVCDLVVVLSWNFRNDTYSVGKRHITGEKDKQLCYTK